MVKNPSANEGDVESIPGLGRYPGGGNGTHPTVLSWESPSTEEPGGVQSMGSQRVRHDLVTKGQQNTEKSQQNERVQCNWMQ